MKISKCALSQLAHLTRLDRRSKEPLARAANKPPVYRLRRDALRVFLAAALGGVLLAGGIAPSNAATGHAQSVDYNCRVSTLSFDKAFSTYWTAEGVGLVGWRVRGSLRVYDQCNHGGIEGTIGIYSANVKYKGGRIGLTNFLFADSSRSAWRRDGVSVSYSFNAGGWDNYDVRVAGNIGLTPSTWIRYIRINTAVSFYGVLGAPRTITCGKGNPMFRAYAC